MHAVGTGIRLVFGAEHRRWQREDFGHDGVDQRFIVPCAVVIGIHSLSLLNLNGLAEDK